MRNKMTQEEFTEVLAEKTEEAEKWVLSALPKTEGFQKTVMDAMHYSVETGGKRLRPLLLMECYRMFAGKDKADTAGEPVVASFMASLEMIHTYSLVHDDLPAMDNDMLRRGKPTTHAVYGEAMGILAGDALLNYAFETGLSALKINRESGSSISQEAVERALQILAKKAGIYGMIGGQVIDVEGEATGEMTREKLDVIYRLKTGALLEASMMIGGCLGGANEKELQVLETVAQKTGLAFQIRDDLLDVLGDTKTLGKPVGSDEKNGKVTYVTYVGVDQAEQDVLMLTEEAIGALSSLQKEDTFLIALLKALINRDK